MHSAVGRRKRAVAVATLLEGEVTKGIVVNGLPVEDYFHSQTKVTEALAPLAIAREKWSEGEMDHWRVKVEGGGLSGQAGAISLSLARTLVKVDPTLRTALRKGGLLTRDPREKERRKYGLKKARKAPQFSKR
ncbi:30S ribosomal protein S9 [bacterium]|nr:30S ribosomal protein S9 [bacterium]